MSDLNMQDRWGLLVQFNNPADLVTVIRELSADRELEIDAYTPFPIDEVSEALQRKQSPIPYWIFIGGVLGGSGMFGLECWINLVAYPLNIGGRPLLSWPSFIPPTFEMTVLFSTFSAVANLLYVCRLPKLHHPVFEIEEFSRASTDSFFVSIKSRDNSHADLQKQLDLCNQHGAAFVWEIPNV